MDMMSLRRRVMVNQNKLMTATGNPITFNTPLTKPLKECVVRFTPKQEGSGTPSPDNVRNISGRSSVKLWQSGGNLLDVNAVTFTSKKCIKTDGSIITSVYYKISNALPCSYLAGKTLTANTVIQGGGASIKSLGFYSSDDITSDSCVLAVHKAHTNDEYVTFTVPNTAKFMVFCMNTSRTLDGRYIIEGTEPLDDSEEVGIPNEITFTFPSTVGDNGVVYGGYLDCETADLVGVWGIIASYNGETLTGAWMSDRDEYVAGTTPTIGAQVAYELETPIHYSLTPQSIATLRGSNVMWSDGDELTVKYWTR